MKPEHWYIASQDNFFGPLRRRPHIAVANNTNILNDTTVLTLRYGFSTWGDSCDKQPFSPGIGTLGFSSNYTNALQQTDVFPELLFDDVVDVGGWGAIPNRWNSPYTFNATLSKLWGNHSLKAGADLRKLGVDTVSATLMGGSFTFDERFTEQQRRRRARAGQRAARRPGVGLRCRTTMARSSGSPSTTAPTSRTTGG